jgi:hypothetical protein
MFTNHITATRIQSDNIDAYSARGITVSRDVAHRIYPALRRDAYELRNRGGDANIEAANELEIIARNISKCLSES